LEVVAAGEHEPADGDRVVQVADGTRHAYHRLVVRSGRVAGLVAVGEHDAVPTFVDWYERGTPVPAAPFGMPSDRRS
jgi:assimilatory nitrate reductase electron transfer subunit